VAKRSLVFEYQTVAKPNSVTLVDGDGKTDVGGVGSKTKNKFGVEPGYNGGGRDLEADYAGENLGKARKGISSKRKTNTKTY